MVDVQLKRFGLSQIITVDGAQTIHVRTGSDVVIVSIYDDFQGAILPRQDAAKMLNDIAYKLMSIATGV